ncbi:MAG: cysteine-rich KTR domain-containing protein [Lachnospiraceae bacterium]
MFLWQLYCPKKSPPTRLLHRCRQETLINIKQLNMSVITEPDAKTQSR